MNSSQRISPSSQFRIANHGGAQTICQERRRLREMPRTKIGKHAPLAGIAYVSVVRARAVPPWMAILAMPETERGRLSSETPLRNATCQGM